MRIPNPSFSKRGTNNYNLTALPLILRCGEVYNRVTHVLKVIEAFKRFGRGYKPRPASVFVKTEAINQSVVCFVSTIHGNWIPAVHAEMTA